jgi:uncharacterized protein
MGIGRVRGLGLALLLALPALARADLPVPPLTGPVVDLAGVLSPQSVARLDSLCRASRARDGGRGVQLQFLVLSSLQGEAIESFSMRVAEAWKLGTKGADNGVLVAVAVDDRKVRIEVGGGLEGALTDVQAGRIIRNTLAPWFRERRYGDGLYAAGVEILGATGGLPEGVARPARAGPPPAALKAFGGAIFTVIFLIAIVTAIVARIFFGLGGYRRRYYGSTWGGGGWGGGGWSSGGGGGGGWSGGGGGFSGGGASGGW